MRTALILILSSFPVGAVYASFRRPGIIEIIIVSVVWCFIVCSGIVFAVSMTKDEPYEKSGWDVK